MPTENEKKYVLKLACHEEIVRDCPQAFEIYQGYVASKNGMTARVRSSRKVGKEKAKYHFCFKYKVETRLIEIEKRIDRRDYHDLWKIALNKIWKIRYNLFYEDRGDAQLWEVDFFLDELGKAYFAMAEFEMAEGELAPDVVPPLISKHVVFEVPLQDDRFTSKKLSCQQHASEMLRSLGVEPCRSNNKLSIP